MSQLGLGSIQQLGTLKLGTLAPGKGGGVPAGRLAFSTQSMPWSAGNLVFTVSNPNG